MTDNHQRRGTFETRIGRIGAVVDEEGTMVRFRFHAERRPDYGVEDDGAIAHIREQVEEYCAGKRKDFDLRYAFVGGSNFERTIWEAMARIPYGETVTYGSMAKEAGDAGAARATGADDAMARHDERQRIAVAGDADGARCATSNP